MGVALNQQIKSERADSLKILSLPTHEQRLSAHLFRMLPSLFSSQFITYRPSTCSVKSAPNCTIQSPLGGGDMPSNGISLLISIFRCSQMVHEKAIDFYVLAVYTAAAIIIHKFQKAVRLLFGTYRDNHIICERNFISPQCMYSSPPILPSCTS